MSSAEKTLDSNTPEFPVPPEAPRPAALAVPGDLGSSSHPLVPKNDRDRVDDASIGMLFAVNDDLVLGDFAFSII